MGAEMTPDDDFGAARLLSRLHLLLQAATASPRDPEVLELALIQAVAATGADSAVLGTLRRRDILDVRLLAGTGGPMHEVGALHVGSRYPLTDAIVQEKPVWLSSPPEIRSSYPTAGGLWGRAFAALPLMVRQVPVGAIGVIHDAAGHYHTGVERVFLSTVADVCATIVSVSPDHRWPMEVGHEPYSSG
ncbi:GAF domain-containing protein [Actinoplanes sp. NPDC049548]|uniref:GAF domain-containing protein n=1 Tax=Actinoplanes sp. NPDC049548 TaxID=3155152 RepID=UPI00344A95BD